MIFHCLYTQPLQNTNNSPQVDSCMLQIAVLLYGKEHITISCLLISQAHVPEIPQSSAGLMFNLAAFVLSTVPSRPRIYSRVLGFALKWVSSPAIYRHCKPQRTSGGDAGVFLTHYAKSFIVY